MPYFAVDHSARPAALALALAQVLLAGCSDAGAVAAPAVERYRLTASGRIDSISEARALAAEQDGIIAKVLVARNQPVVVGQPIMRMACDDKRATLAAVRAEALAAEAQARLVAAGPRREDRMAASAHADEVAARLRDAVDQLSRAEALHSQGFVSNRRLEELRAEAAARQAQLAAAEAEAQIKQSGSRPDERLSAEAVAAAATATADAQAANYAKCTLRSPINGIVVQVLKREGEFSAATSGAPVVVVADLSRMIVRAEIADRDASRAAVGQVVEVWIDGDPRRWRGRLTTIANLMGRKTARSLDPSDRFDRDVREAIVGFDGPQPPAIVGLRVNIGVLT